MPRRSGVSSTICQIESSSARKRGSRLMPSGRGRSNGIEDALDARGAAHHHHPIRQVQGFVDLMGDEEDRLARARPDLEQLRLHVLARLRVERGERLVHEQHDWIEASARARLTRCCMPPESSDG